MCIVVKYGIWNVAGCSEDAAGRLVASGISPLVARVLASRGMQTPEAARAFLAPETALVDPLLLQDMDKAVVRVRQALAAGERICVYGDYDVDGITATCLLTDYLLSCGGDVTHYIPGRLEEGYGLNMSAVDALAEQGVKLIITVDCGITALDEALRCRELGVGLIITDHHECKDELPDACCVVDPHRRDAPYPYGNLAGVGVAFKLAAALSEDQNAMLDRYCDLLCLGTVADVMPLLGENRCFVSRGLRALEQSHRPGIAALLRACGNSGRHVTAGTIGYTLAPRINAAGRMGQVELATELFLTDSQERAEELADQLCKLNRQRQQVEQEIYADAVRLLGAQENPDAIVLASEQWHQGVVGIVASRLAEEYRCPVFLICLDGDKGKASSRSHGGFNLFQVLDELSPLLESFGGHELAAGFTIRRENIDAFRDAVCARSRDYYTDSEQLSALEIDCEAPLGEYTLQNVADLDLLEPCGSGCPSPVFCLSGMRVEQLSEVGGGKHLRLRLSRDGESFPAIFFSNTAKKAAVTEGDRVDIAFTPQVNEYRGIQSVQFVLCDIRPDAATRTQADRDRALYQAVQAGRPCAEALPERGEFVAVWKYLASRSSGGRLVEDALLFCRDVARFSGLPCSFLRTQICLDVFSEQGLIDLEKCRSTLHIHLTAQGKKADLTQSNILCRIREHNAQAKE